MRRPWSVFDKAYDEYLRFNIEPSQAIIASETKAENFLMTDSSGNMFSAERILYFPKSNSITLITENNICLSGDNACTITYTSQKNDMKETIEAFPTILRGIESESVGIVDYCFYDSDNKPVYDIEGRRGLTFKATIHNSSDDDIKDRTFSFLLNGFLSQKVDEKKLSLNKKESIIVEILCDFELNSGDTITLY